MNTNYTITIASDAEHEKVYAEIHCRGKFVALVNQENGFDRLKIEFPPAGLDEAMIVRVVDMEGFQQALISAAKELCGGKA